MVTFTIYAPINLLQETISLQRMCACVKIRSKLWGVCKLELIPDVTSTRKRRKKERHKEVACSCSNLSCLVDIKGRLRIKRGTGNTSRYRSS